MCIYVCIYNVCGIYYNVILMYDVCICVIYLWMCRDYRPRDIDIMYIYIYIYVCVYNVNKGVRHSIGVYDYNACKYKCIYMHIYIWAVGVSEISTLTRPSNNM